MEIILDFTGKEEKSSSTHIIGAYQTKDSKGKPQASVKHWSKEIAEEFNDLKTAKNFTAGNGEIYQFTDDGIHYFAVGLGEKKSAKNEAIRKAIAKALKAASSTKEANIVVHIDHFNTIRSTADTAYVVAESAGMTNYKFDKYLSKKNENPIKKLILSSSDKKSKAKAAKSLDKAITITESIKVARDFVNEPPNVLRSDEYAKRIEKDARETFKGKGVKVKVLNKAAIKKEKMNLLLSVNSGSAFEPRIVHLSYIPKKVTKNTKHIALVGKGLVFDTGGYSLKPSASMINMKFDMAGSATVYGAFRAAVLQGSPHKLTCVLAITDNAVSSMATMPDAIVKGRSGTTVEILNTDAEGRLALADALDYTCDLKPNVILDAATLTGACLVALGTQVAAILGNDDKLISTLQKHAKNVDEYLWQLPIIPEWREEMKSPIADLQNIGKTRFAGTATAAAFLENFIKNDIKWAHFDIAGVGDSQGHLPYCPAKGASGIMIRTMTDYLVNGKV